MCILEYIGIFWKRECNDKYDRSISQYIDDGGDDDESDDRVVEMKYSCGRYRDTLVDEVKGGLVKNDTWGRLMP